MGAGSTVRALVERTVRDLVVVPVVTALSARLDRMEQRMSSSYDEAFARFADITTQGFANVRRYVADEIRKATENGDQQSQERLARLDAQLDGLAAGFNQFAAQAPVEASAEQLPPVVNPDTPAPAETVPDVATELPIDPQAVLDDPSIPTPNDPGSEGSDGATG